MFRVNGPTAGPGGSFVGGDPAVPTPPTAVPPWWLTMVQEELAAIVLAAGLTLNQSNSAQVLAGIQQLITNSSFALASDSEAIAGTVTNKGLTPHSGAALVTDRINALVAGAPGALNTLKELADAVNDDANFAATVTAALTARAMASRLVSTTGLVTGGGDMTADRTLKVIAASVADYIAGTAADRALTPASLAGAGGSNANGHWSYLPGGALMQWGSIWINAAGANVGSGSVTFPTPFPVACESITGNTDAASGTWSACVVVFPGAPTQTGSTVAIDTTNASRTMNASKQVWWKALGR